MGKGVKETILAAGCLLRPAAAKNMAESNGWKYVGSADRKRSIPTCSQGTCRGSFQAKFERSVTR